ncbi:MULTISPECIES: hypothetical protein [unclassified Nocardia]|uniref:hypothetical protein n=1 Tax=unclassified Nocardia TaxID=2637762 RepID=UPI001CE4B432|nr:MULTISPECIES: hypothetical protein [unclassified Nocardia]
MNGPEPQRDPRPPSPESAASVLAKSSVWQGFLGIAWVISTSMILEIGSKLLEGWVGASHLLAPVAGWLSGVAVFLIVFGAAYALWVKVTELRRRAELLRITNTTADLVQPGLLVRARAAQFEPEAPELAPDLPYNLIAAILRDLDFRTFETAALYEVVAAALAAPARVPDAPIDNRTPGEVLTKLVEDSILVRGVQDQVRLARVPLLPETEEVQADPAWAAALPTLVRHYADRATQWSVALDSTALSPGAQRWFDTEGIGLCQLVLACAGMDPEIARLLVPELSRIADALDIWFARKGWDEAEYGVAQTLSRLAAETECVVERELAEIRNGTAEVKSLVSPLHRYSVALRARRALRSALRELAEPSPELVVAQRYLDTAWRQVPHTDIPGRVCVLIDLAEVHLRQWQLDTAQHCLQLAESLTSDGRDPAGRAQVHETLGVLLWARGEPRRGLRYWQWALAGYRELDHELGTARCLQHLGSAVVVAPPYGSLLLGDETEVTEAEVLRQATGWLAESMNLRPPHQPLAERYWEAARARLARLRPFDPDEPEAWLPLDRIDRWPLPDVA